MSSAASAENPAVRHSPTFPNPFPDLEELFADVCAGVREFRLSLAPGAPCGPVRQALRRVLGAWGVGQHADDVTLVATELLQNAVEHTMAGCVLRLRLRPD